MDGKLLTQGPTCNQKGAAGRLNPPTEIHADIASRLNNKLSIVRYAQLYLTQAISSPVIKLCEQSRFFL
jgi:hypothetical protein